LYSQLIPGSARNLWDVPNVFMQKFPAPEFMVTTRLSFKPNSKIEGEEAGLVIMGQSYAALSLKSTREGIRIVSNFCKDAVDGNPEKETIHGTLPGNTIYFRTTIADGAVCKFSYSTDGKKFVAAGEDFIAKPGKWIGAKVGLFCARPVQINDSGYVDVDWFRIEPLK